MSCILLIEGMGQHGQELADSLRADGHTVTEVTGREHLAALLQLLQERAGEAKLDLIIGDAEQSGGPGLDLLLEAQGIGGGTPVILLSEAADVDLLREAEALRAAYVFFSPAEVNALRLATRKLA